MENNNQKKIGYDWRKTLGDAEADSNLKNPVEVNRQDKSIGAEKHEHEKNEHKERVEKFDAADLITKKDVGRTVKIITMLDTTITGRLERTSPYEMEITLLGAGEKIILYKQGILFVQFLDLIESPK